LLAFISGLPDQGGILDDTNLCVVNDTKAALRQHFMTADGQLPSYANNINQNVFALLGQDIDPTRPQELKDARELAGCGNTAEATSISLSGCRRRFSALRNPTPIQLLLRRLEAHFSPHYRDFRYCGRTCPKERMRARL
jgi:hypothetical protein